MLYAESEPPPWVLRGLVHLSRVSHTDLNSSQTGFCDCDNSGTGYKGKSQRKPHLFWFVSLFTLDRQRTDRKWKGKKNMLKRLWGICSGAGADVKPLAPYRKSHFHFTKRDILQKQGIFQAYFFQFSGGWVSRWKVVGGGISSRLYLTALWAFAWFQKTNKGAFPPFFHSFCCYLIVTDGVSLC